MAKIVFRGKTYHSVFEMPAEVRRAYQIEKSKSGDRKIANPLTDFVEMSDELKEIYERALGDVEAKPLSSRPLKELPKTEDLYRQAEQASRTPAPTAPPAIEVDDGPRRLVLTLLVMILLAAALFIVVQYAS